MRKRHQLVIGAVGMLLLVGSVLVTTAGVSSATPLGGGSHHSQGGYGDKCHKQDHDKRQKKHDKKKQKCKPKRTTTTTSTTTSSVPEDTVPEDTVPEDTVPEDTVPEDTVPEDTVPEDTVPEDTVPEDTVPTDVAGETTVLGQPAPEVLAAAQELPEAQAEELAFTGVSNTGLAAAGIGLLLLGVALVSGRGARRGAA